MPDRLIRLAILLALAVVALAPASASASMLDDFRAIGVEFHAQRGVTVRADVTLRLAPAPCGVSEADGCIADGIGGRDMVLRSGLVRAATRERWREGRGGDSERLTLCTTVVHELGHVGGLAHTETGLMSPMGGATPYECVRWLARAERTERRAFVARRARR